ncbi:hypothetical protein SAMN02927924_02656 [Sphingobium faniae]|nr:hypothetical protein SAMN02927924_02656 [Sphingobium faniae]
MFRAALTVCLVSANVTAAAQEAVTTGPPSASAVAIPSPRWVQGTDVELMVVREVNSRSARAGDQFRLRVNAPVVLDGATVIPVGSSAWGEVISAKGTGAAGGKGQLSLHLLHVDTAWGPVRLAGTQGAEGDANTGGVILGVLGFGLLGLLNKGGNATFKAGDIIHGYIAEGEAAMTAPLTVSTDALPLPAGGSESQAPKRAAPSRIVE